MKVSAQSQDPKPPLQAFESTQREVASAGPSEPPPAELKVPLGDPEAPPVNHPLPPPPHPAIQANATGNSGSRCFHNDEWWMWPSSYGHTKKSVLEAYLLGLPLGFLGAHHFYLRRYAWGVLYLFTFGFFGWGWVADLFRMPYLVCMANKRIEAGHCPNCPAEKNLCDAYTMWFPFGIFGAHHFYLGRPGWGVAYMFTVGLLGVGWLVDAFRLPALVRQANRRQKTLTKSTCTAYALGLPPIPGFLGAHHYYLGRYAFGILYTFSFGLLGVGYLVDICRMPCLVKHVNKTILEGDNRKKRLDDAYLLCFPFGFLGLHHFYLHRYGWGTLYLLTFGVLGIGWVIDWFRLPCLVSDYNKAIDKGCLLPGAPCPHHVGHPHSAPPAGPHGVDPRQSGPQPSYMSQENSLTGYSLHSSELPSSNVSGQYQGGVDNPALNTRDLQAGHIYPGLPGPAPPQYTPYPGYGAALTTYPPEAPALSNHQPPSYEQATIPGVATEKGKI